LCLITPHKQATAVAERRSEFVGNVDTAMSQSHLKSQIRGTPCSTKVKVKGKRPFLVIIFSYCAISLRLSYALTSFNQILMLKQCQFIVGKIIWYLGFGKIS
jgi:hypothetical protein